MRRHLAMRRYLAVAAAVAFAWLAAPAGVLAADLGNQQPIAVAVQLGTETGDLVIAPDKLTFEKGKLYKIVLKNPSDSEHQFSVPRFASAVQTRKIEIDGAKVKRTLTRVRRPPAISFPVELIKVIPGGKAEWVFVPIRADSFDFGCAVPGHAEAGLVGEITVM